MAPMEGRRLKVTSYRFAGIWAILVKRAPEVKKEPRSPVWLFIAFFVVIDFFGFSVALYDLGLTNPWFWPAILGTLVLEWIYVWTIV